MNVISLGTVFLFSAATASTDLTGAPSMVSLIPEIPEQAVREACTKTHWKPEIETRSEEARRMYFRARDAYQGPKVTGREWTTDPGVEAADAVRIRAGAELSAMEAARTECVDRGLAASLPTLHLREKPEAGSRKLGEIRMSLGDAGLQYRFVDGSGKEIPFEPDSYDGDWSYDSIYHTALRRSGDWVQLPRRPFPAPVWIDLRELGAPARVVLIQNLHVVELRSPGFTGAARILGIDKTGVRVRAETAGDMPCGDEPAGPPTTKKTFTLPLKDLSDADGHLRLSEQYSRGC